MPLTLRARHGPGLPGRKFVAYAVLATLLLGGLALLGYLTISQLLAALDVTEQSISVRAQLRQVRTLVGDMEAAQRNYVITGDRAYLEAFQGTEGLVDTELDRLVKLTVTDAEEQSALARLRDLVDAKRSELNDGVEAFQARGYEAARAVAASDAARQVTADIREVAAAIEAEEARRIAAWRQEQRQSLQRTVLLAVLVCGLLGALLATIYYLLRREMATHAAHEDALRAANADLEARIAERTRSVEESQAQLNAIVNGAPDAIISMGEDEKIVVANPAAANMFGYATGELIGVPIERLIPERYRPGHHAHVRRFEESGVFTRRMSVLRVVHARRSNGTEFPVDASISQVMIAGAKLYTVILRDITDEVRAKAEIEQSRRELRELTAALEYVQEEERKRIAQELHDDLGQQLTVLKMDASLIRRKLSPEQQDALRIAERLEGVLIRTVQSVRRISADLRPAMLDDLGLVPALDELVQQISQHSGLECRLAASEDLRVADKLATPLFRVAQESLNNAVKHAQASQITVSLFESDRALVLRVEDDGKGIAPDDQRKRKSHGLIGMRERVYALGGEFALTSAPGRGTTVEVKIPVSP